MNITDPVPATKQPGKTDSLLGRLVQHEGNIQFIRFLILVLLTTFPVAILLYIPGYFSWWLAGAYLLYNLIFITGPFILIQHNVAHKALFRKKYKYLNGIIPWFFGPLMGLTPETYTSHHIGMPHPENNLSGDLNSTMRYQRDSIRDFAAYYVRFFIFTIPLLSSYLYMKNRKRLRNKMLAGETIYLLVVTGLFIINPIATLVVFLFPLWLTRSLMITGNWAQHAFVDSGDPGNCFRNSITCINSRYNRTCWNDGYHIGHHIHPWMHWRDMPGDFLNNLEAYRKEQAVIFAKLDYFVIWFLLMTKSYGILARYFVDLETQHPRSRPEIVALLKQRTRRIG